MMEGWAGEGQDQGERFRQNCMTWHTLGYFEETFSVARSPREQYIKDLNGRTRENRNLATMVPNLLAESSSCCGDPNH